MNSRLNERKDEYGGSAKNRTRIVREILGVLLATVGPGRVGIKISPTLAMGGFAPTDQTIATYDYLLEHLNTIPLSHLQVVRARTDLSSTTVAALQDTIAYYRARFNGTLIANGGFDGLSAARAIETSQTNLVSFARPFIGSPDLVKRFRDDLPLRGSTPDTYYQGGPKGYTDYLSSG